jgi:hypothetical protein
MSQASANEQYLLELINATRVQAGVQPLAFDGALNDAAERHSRWMIATDTFSHTGSGGSSAGDRIASAGYVFSGSWTWGENIAWASTRPPAGDQDEVQLLHTNLMNSPGHRANILDDRFREIGLGFEIGEYQGYQSAFVTENFARSGSGFFLTGVAFDDRDGDRSYDPGEGLGALVVTAVGAAGTYTTATEVAGGYDLLLPDGSYSVTFAGGGFTTTTAQATIAGKNVKLDLTDPAPSAGTPPAGGTPPPSGPGDEVIVGSDGRDEWQFSGAFREYVVSGNPTTAATVLGPEGQRTLQSIEALTWVDGTLTFDPGDPIAQVLRLYSAALDRAPDALGLNFHAARLDHGIALSALAGEFVASPEFRAKYGNLDNAGFVTQLYQNVLDRAPEPGGLGYWLERLAGGTSRADVLIGFSESREHVQKNIGPVDAGLWDIDEHAASVARLYLGTLDRHADAPGLAYHAQHLRAGLPLTQVAESFVTSPEFLGKYGSLGHGDYVARLYENVLERAPDAAGLAYWVEKLDAGVLDKGGVALGFTESPEYQAKTLPEIDHGVLLG